MRTKYHFDNNFTTDPKFFGNLILYQLGEMMCDSSTVVEPHVHLDWFEFTYVFQGTGTIFTNDVSLEVNEGDIYVSYPREIHKIVSDNINPLRYCFFAFSNQPRANSSCRNRYFTTCFHIKFYNLIALTITISNQSDPLRA